MKINQLLFYLLMVSLVSAMSCGDDDDDDNDDDVMLPDPQIPLVDTYSFTSAFFADDAVIVVNSPANSSEPIAAPFPAGANGSDFLRDAIEGAAPCNDNVRIGIDLREDNTAYYVCEQSSDELQMGVWTLNADSTVFTLTITSLDPDFDVIMEDFQLSLDGLRGTATIPLPYDAFIDPATGMQRIPTGDPLDQTSVDALAVLDVILDVGTPNIQTVDMDITFLRADF